MAKPKQFVPSNKLMRYVDFTRFAVNQKIEAYDVAELVTLAERAFKAGERSCNSGQEKESVASEKASKLFEEKAKALGFSVSWPGLWPSLRRVEEDGVERDVYLPTIHD